MVMCGAVFKMMMGIGLLTRNTILCYFELNVDWFQLFTHLTDSVGAMYLSIQILPRGDRY